jgi:two-component system chemotaxis response regulator CheB
MTGHDIIVVGTSTGGVEALQTLARGLPSGFPASLFVVCHTPPYGKSRLPEILSRAGPLLATHPANGETFYPGQIYVAPPDHHMVLAGHGRVRLTRGPRENHHRPAVDPLFRSAARWYGPRVIGVVLTGSLHDGTAGLMAVATAGGVTVVQDPAEALVDSMPRSAEQLVGPDHVVKLADLPRLLSHFVQEPVSPKRRAALMDPIDRMPDIVDQDMAEQQSNGRRGEVSMFTCPECGGALWQVDETGVIRFRCHVGHAYRGEVLLSEQGEALEAALWTAVRIFREKSVLSLQMARHERADGDPAFAARLEEQAGQAAQFGELIRQLLLNGGPPAERAGAGAPAANGPSSSPA